MPAGPCFSRGVQVGQIKESQRQAARHPGEREHGRHHVRGPGRALLEELQDLADRLAVVVGGVLRPHVLFVLVGHLLVGHRGRAAFEQVFLLRMRLGDAGSGE